MRVYLRVLVRLQEEDSNVSAHDAQEGLMERDYWRWSPMGALASGIALLVFLYSISAVLGGLYYLWIHLRWVR